MSYINNNYYLPSSEAKMGPWDNEEIVCLIELYRHQIDEFGDDHIDFQVNKEFLFRRKSHFTLKIIFHRRLKSMIAYLFT